MLIIATSTFAQPTPQASPPPKPEVVNPAASVPAVQYRSVFVDTPKGVEQTESDWKQTNAEVGRFTRGHIDLLKWEKANPERAPAATEKVAPPANPAGAKP